MRVKVSFWMMDCTRDVISKLEINSTNIYSSAELAYEI